jgi:hypothetical protein
MRPGARLFRILAEHREPKAGAKSSLRLDELLETLKRTLRLTLRKASDEDAACDSAERTAWRSEFVGVVEDRSFTVGSQLVDDRGA